MTKDELVARLRDIEWNDFEVKAAKLFWYAGIAENAGYGMNKLASREALTGTRPTIESDRTIATVSFPLKSAVQSLVSTDMDVPANVGVNVGVKLTRTQKRALQLMRDNPSITHAEISQSLIMKILPFLAVFVGSGLGGVCRYALSRAVQSWFPAATAFPWGTFAVNVLGCFLIGLFYGLADRGALMSPQLRLLLTVGFCGGFTTFSTFINENSLLFGQSRFLLVVLYMLLSIAVGFALLYAGYRLVR